MNELGTEILQSIHIEVPRSSIDELTGILGDFVSRTGGLIIAEIIHSDETSEQINVLPVNGLYHNQSVATAREQLAGAVAQILKRGYTLTTDEVREILPHYGYSPNNPISFIVNSLGFREAVSGHEVDFGRHKYKGRVIYVDENLPENETDYEDTQARIRELNKRKSS